MIIKMKIIKPLRLSIMHRPYYKNDTSYLSVAILALVDMKDALMQLRPEPELWQLAKDELTCSQGIIDLVYPKSYPEFLAVGYAYPHSYLSENVCQVSITLGDKQKSLIVSGDRQWHADMASKPATFHSMPIDWAHAYGGEHVLDNPQGIGAENNQSSHWLPNIELPSERLTFPSQMITPAGFGPIDFTWPARQQYIGKNYDEEWVKKGALGFASDTDPRLFNMAPEDQQWLEHTSLPPSMPYLIENMHPECHLQSGTLPAWKARCFIHHTTLGKTLFSEIEMRHTTVWFVPHLDKMIFVYHGVYPIEEDDAHNVHLLMPALEESIAPRSIEHYRDVWLKRSDKEKGATYAFQDQDLIPENAIGEWIDTQQNTREVTPLQQNLTAGKQSVYQEIESKLQAVGTQLPARVKASPELASPTLSQLPAFMAQLEGMADQAQNEAKQHLNQHIETAQEFEDKRPAGPFAFYQLCENLRQQQKGELKATQRENLYQLYRLSVQTQHRISPLTDSEKVKLRQWVIAKLSQDRDFTDCDLTGADLSHLDFSGANLTRTMMESADLSDAVFNDCQLTQTLLARTKMHKTRLRNSELYEVTFAQSDCKKCDFTGATLVNSVTEEAVFDDCDFSQANISNQLFQKASFDGCYFYKASFKNVIFNNETILKETNFSAAQFFKSSFTDCEMPFNSFKDAQLQNCAMVDCNASHCDFTQAKVQQSAFLGSTSLANTTFGGAHFTQCNLAKINLDNSKLHRAKFIECDFSEASLISADLSYLQANNSTFIRTYLQASHFEHANLMGCLLKKAYLIGCNFNRANLFRADISQAIMDETTTMEDAFIKQMKVYPLYTNKGVA